MTTDTTRVSRKRLEKLAEGLSPRDREILCSLQKCRYLTTTQLQRLHFADALTNSAALRATERGLLKLKGLGLLANLNRRVGGVRAGSSSYVWALTPVAFKLLYLNTPKEEQRKRFFEPSPVFLQHIHLLPYHNRMKL